VFPLSLLAMLRLARTADTRFAYGCAATIFLSALLLFQVQPVIGKMVLPWFGGSPSVWTTCMLFFQVLLVGGYAYAHFLTKVRSRRWVAGIHGILLLVAALFLPITPSAAWRPPGDADPTWYMLKLLAAHVGLPYFLLATTGPLVQAWFARAYPARSPYRLYALSNIGSLGALLSYPLLIEPALTTLWQGRVWSGLFVLFAAMCGSLAIVYAGRVRDELKPQATATQSSRRPECPVVRSVPQQPRRVLSIRRPGSIGRCGSCCRRWLRSCSWR
jgi:hypothetical protein